MITCPKCHGEGKITTRELKPVTMTTKDWVEKEETCDLCSGTGQVQENSIPLVIEKLDQIIKLLEEIKNRR